MPSALPPGWLGDTATLYARVFRRGLRLALANWPVGLVVVLYLSVLGMVGLVATRLGLVGGLLLYVTTVACVSSWLSLVEQVIRAGRVRLRDLPGGFVSYLNDLLTVVFLVWGLQFLATLVLAPFTLLHIVFVLAVVVFFNAVPELIYLGRHTAAELLVESYRFIGENWIEWFPANLALALPVLAANTLSVGPYNFVGLGLVGLALYFAMIVRGLLFLELAGSTRRAREFRRRAAS